LELSVGRLNYFWSVCLITPVALRSANANGIAWTLKKQNQVKRAQDSLRFAVGNFAFSYAERCWSRDITLPAGQMAFALRNGPAA
jgi:hypothetical protein